jgi:hypothetical protein
MKLSEQMITSSIERLDPISAQPPDRITGINSVSMLSQVLSVSGLVLFAGLLTFKTRSIYENLSNIQEIFKLK